MQLGGILREMRKRAGLSQEEMAEALHMSISNISRFENDIYDIKAIDFFRWAKITNNPDVLMAIYAAIDVATQIEPITQMITGTITLLGGLI